MAMCTRYNIMWQSLSVACDRSVVFSGTPVSSTNKTYHHDLTEIMLNVVLNTITLFNTNAKQVRKAATIQKTSLIYLSVYDSEIHLTLLQKGCKCPANVQTIYTLLSLKLIKACT